MTGWGQTGPLAHAAGHDINYIALSGALEPIGRAGQPPLAPLNLVGDFGGGGMFLVVGVLSALIERQRSGKGQVIDAAMVDGSALLMTMFHGLRELGGWCAERGTNMIDTGSHYYEVYECSDGKYVAIGAIEPQFYAEFRRLLNLDDPRWDSQTDRAAWPDRKRDLAEIFKARTRSEWCDVLEGSDACFAPVLSLDEVHRHPHNAERGTFIEFDGVLQPAPAPRFSRTPAALERGPVPPGTDSRDVLEGWGFSSREIDDLVTTGAVACNTDRTSA